MPSCRWIRSILANGMTAGILDVDIRKYFDTLDHGHLQALLRHRVRDGVLLRLIGKWLNAGVLEDGELSHPDEGTPQGGVISPLLFEGEPATVIGTAARDVVERVTGSSERNRSQEWLRGA